MKSSETLPIAWANPTKEHRKKNANFMRLYNLTPIWFMAYFLGHRFDNMPRGYKMFLLNSAEQEISCSLLLAFYCISMMNTTSETQKQETFLFAGILV